MNWIIGFSVSLIVGYVVSASTLVFLRRYIEDRKDADKLLSQKQKRNFFLSIDFYPPDDSSVRQVAPWLTGPAKGQFFTFIVAFTLSGAAISMIGRLAIFNLLKIPVHIQIINLEKRFKSVYRIKFER